jgi:hypothetical protein
MRFPIVTLSVLLFAGSSALAQAPKPGAAPPAAAPAKPYKTVAVKLPEPVKDPAFEAFRKQLGDIAAKKDRAALGKLVADQGFFWDRENGDAADKKKPGVDNLANALGLNNKDGAGWDMLNGYSQDPTASASPDHKGALCAPGDPAFNDKELQEVVKATGTDVPDWAYTLAPGVEAHSGPKPGSPVIEKLGLQFVRIMPDADPSGATTTMKIVTPSGKTGYVPGDSVAPLGNDQICYVKDASGWKVGGYIGGGESQ